MRHTFGGSSVPYLRAPEIGRIQGYDSNAARKNVIDEFAMGQRREDGQAG